MRWHLQHPSLGELTLRHVAPEDEETIIALESAGFPKDEMASPENIHMRVTQAKDYFIVVERAENEMIGFINGTCVRDEDLHHDCMSSHDPLGRHLVIHSVTVHPQYRRQGVGLLALKKYVQILLNRNGLESILLLTKAYLIGFYSSAGFAFKRPSNIVHGQVLTILTVTEDLFHNIVGALV